MGIRHWWREQFDWPELDFRAHRIPHFKEQVMDQKMKQEAPAPDQHSGEETMRDWNTVQEDLGKSITERIRIPNGSLYRTIVYHSQGTGPSAVSMVFVPHA
jgi:hypothetical protein